MSPLEARFGAQICVVYEFARPRNSLADANSIGRGRGFSSSPGSLPLELASIEEGAGREFK